MVDMAWTALPDGTIDFVNEKARIYGGDAPGDAHNLFESLHPDDRQTFLDRWKASHFVIQLIG